MVSAADVRSNDIRFLARVTGQFTVLNRGGRAIGPATDGLEV